MASSQNSSAGLHDAQRHSTHNNSAGTGSGMSRLNKETPLSAESTPQFRSLSWTEPKVISSEAGTGTPKQASHDSTASNEVGGAAGAGAGAGGPHKGGHSLRKRARVDYTFEHIDDLNARANLASASASASRSKRRRTDLTEDFDTSHASPNKRRGASAGADSPSARRRNPSRKALESRSYRMESSSFHLNGHADVQDTIEVGVSFPDSNGPDYLYQETQQSPSAEHVQSPLPLQPNQSSYPDHFGTESHQGPSWLGDHGHPESYTTSFQSSTPLRDNGQYISDPTAQLQEESLVARQIMQSPQPVDPLLMADYSSYAPEFQAVQDPGHQENPTTAAHPPNEVEQTTADLSASPLVHFQDAVPSNHGVSDAEAKVDDALNLEIDPALMEVVAEVQEPQVSLTSSTPAQPEEPIHPIMDSAQQGEVVASTVTAPDVTPQASDQATPNDELVVIDSSQANVDTVALQAEAELQQSSLNESASNAVLHHEVVPESNISLVSNDSIQPHRRRSVASHRSLESLASKIKAPRPLIAPVGRWSHLTPYIDGEQTTYPEKKSLRGDEDGPGEDQSAEEKDAEKDAEKDQPDMEPMVEDNEETGDLATQDTSTPMPATPIRGSPAPDIADPSSLNSPALVVEETEDTESQEMLDEKTYYKYRKLRNPEEFTSVLGNYEDMSKEDLYELVEAINISMVQWQTEYQSLGKLVDDYENSQRRRVADLRYESRTRDLQQHGNHWEEPEFVVRGHKAKEKDLMTDTRYLQGQDRIMAATYGFEYDPHPSKIGRQNPDTQQVGIMTRGRSLRNQPKQTAKATEGEEVTGKRQRKPVQLFETGAHEASRSSTPLPGRMRRRKNGGAEPELNPTSSQLSFNEEASDTENGLSRTRRRRGPREKQGSVNDRNPASTQPYDVMAGQEEEGNKPTRRGRPRLTMNRQEELADPGDGDVHVSGNRVIDGALPSPPRFIVTLKYPKTRQLADASIHIPDNGDSRPGTSSSDATSNTVDSSYSLRPNRQKRFRDEPGNEDIGSRQPAKKRGKRTEYPELDADEPAPTTERFTPEPQDGKSFKIRVVNSASANSVGPESRTGTPSSLPNIEDGDDRKDYKSMTKSEKMSASMKSKFHQYSPQLLILHVD